MVAVEESGVHWLDDEFVSANEVMIESGGAFVTTTNLQQVLLMLEAEFDQVHQTNKKQVKHRLGELVLDYCRVRPGINGLCS